MTINFKKILIMLVVLFLGFVCANADGAYKNELTKVSLSPVGASDVKVTLYMTKPYTEPLRLLKKNDGEFVLILPETYNSAPQKPSISDVIGEVTDADIKLYSFVSNSAQNGYTKIVIKTNGLVNLYPEAVTVGGGHVVNKPKEEVNKIIYEQIKPVKNNAAPSTSVVAQNTQPKGTAEKKKQDVAPQNTKKTAKAEISEKTKTPETTKTEPKIKIPVPTMIDEVPVAELPDIKNINYSEQTEVPLEEITVPAIENNKQENSKTNFLTVLKEKFLKTVPVIDLNTHESRESATGNILTMLVSLLLVVFSIKFAISVIKNAKPKEESPFDSLTFEKQASTEDKKAEYSEFFKTLIESETKGDNPFSIETPSNSTIVNIPVAETPKSHEEVMNADQNLTWQEKFRALQKNKKTLLNTKEENPTNMEIREDMHIENPIKKLKQDFKAVRKVLERQRNNSAEPSTLEKEFTPEKMEKIEVISFEDFQKNAERPKVQINKTLPIKTKAPKVLTQLQLGEKRGLYLVEYKDKVSLIGYINDKVFKLNTYSSLRDTKMYARLSEKADGRETYIVKFDNNKMLVDVDDEHMKLKLMY